MEFSPILLSKDTTVIKDSIFAISLYNMFVDYRDEGGIPLGSFLCGLRKFIKDNGYKYCISNYVTYTVEIRRDTESTQTLVIEFYSNFVRISYSGFCSYTLSNIYMNEACVDKYKELYEHIRNHKSLSLPVCDQCIYSRRLQEYNTAYDKLIPTHFVRCAHEEGKKKFDEDTIIFGASKACGHFQDSWT